AVNTDVVVDDIGFFNAGPYDGTSYISANTSNALNTSGNRIRVYGNAVGNEARVHYQEPFVDSGFTYATERVHRFQATASTSDAGFGFRCSPNFAVYCGDTVTVLS